ncbi:natriuretic peptides A [Pelodytes ibericus]
MRTSLVKHITFSLLLLAVMGARGGPVYSSSLSTDLTDLKDILARLEDRLPSEDLEAAQSQDLLAQNYDTADSSNSAPSWPGEGARPQSDLAYTRGSWGAAEKLSPLKSKLRELLNTPRSFRRSSDCFGSRIDKIGAQSGMGCNNRRSSDKRGSIGVEHGAGLYGD